MSRYVFSNEAEIDLVKIYRYGFITYGENKADLYIEALKGKCQFLADMPNLSPDRDEFNPPIKIHHQALGSNYSIKIKIVIYQYIIEIAKNINLLICKCILFCMNGWSPVPTIIKNN